MQNAFRSLKNNLGRPKSKKKLPQIYFLFFLFHLVKFGQTLGRKKNYKPFEPFQFSLTIVEVRENLPNYSLSRNVTF